MKSLQFSVKAGLLIVALSAASAPAQVVVQTITLQTGWNSVYLQIDPRPTDPSAVFAGTTVTSCWAYEPPPTAPLPTGGGPTSPASPGKAQWLVWLPASNPGSVANTLHVLTGSRVYLIEASAPGTYTLYGIPNGEATTWRRGFNLGGFRVRPEPNSQPTFSNYLAPSTALSNATIWSINSAQTPVQVTNLGTTRIGANQGYWVNATGNAEYDGPVRVDALTRRGIDFGKVGLTHQVTVENLSTTTRTVTLSHETTDTVFLPGVPDNAGDVPMTRLEYGSGGQPGQIFQHAEFGTYSANLDSATLQNGHPLRVVKLEVNRNGLPPAELDRAGNGADYQAAVKLIDNTGWQLLVPVSAQVLGSNNFGGGGNSLAGLWMGDVTINNVSWVTAPLSGDNDSTTPRPVKRPFIFRVIVHSAGSGVCKLLTEVTLLWQNGTPGDPNHQPPIPPTPGHYVLATPTCTVCDGLAAGSIVDGEPFARRLSTAAFSFSGDRTLTGSLGPGGVLSDTILIAANDRLNPFRHQYHPDHDGNQSGEVYDVTRNISLLFDSSMPPNFPSPGWGDKVLTGTYSENVVGINKDTIYATGTFELRKVSSVPTLNNE